MDNEKRLAKEAKELERLQKTSAKHDGKYYLAILILVLTIVYVVDEITSGISSAMQPYAIFDFFKLTSTSDPAYDVAAGQLALYTFPAMLVMFLSPFYKSLADKWGRKVFLIMNTCGMGLGMLISCTAPNIYVYVLGFMIIQFFVPNDVQVMYIMECAPAKHRAKLCSITKAIALVSVSLIGVFRGMFYHPEVVTSWRMVYAIPVIIALVVGLGSIFFINETPVFTKQRIEYLQATEEERKAMKEEKPEENNGGVVSAFKYIFSHRQTKAIVIAAVIFSLTTGITNYYMTVLQAGADTGMLTEAGITTICVIFPFVNGLITFVGGFITDALGRKKSCIVLAVMTIVGLALFTIGAHFGFSATLIGCAYGLFVGGLYSISDILYLVMPAESVPTQCRASVMGTMSFLGAIATGLSWAIVIVSQMIFSAKHLGLVYLIMMTPITCLALYLLMTRVNETQGADLTAITDERI